MTVQKTENLKQNMSSEFFVGVIHDVQLYINIKMFIRKNLFWVNDTIFYSILIKPSQDEMDVL